MDGLALIPTPDTIPAPWWVFEGLGLVTFVLHLLFANAVVGGTLLNFGDASVLPRYLHFVTAAVAVTGLFAALVWSRHTEGASTVALDRVRSGLSLFAVGTAVQIGVGFCFLIALPAPVRLDMLGGSAGHTAVLAAGIGLGIAAMVTGFLGHLRATVILLLATVVTMALNRALVRAAYLADFFAPGSLELRPQYGVMALFLVVFVLGLGLVAHMLKMLLEMLI